MTAILVQFPNESVEVDDVEEHRVLTALEVIYEGGSLHGKTADFPTRDLERLVVGVHERDWHFFETYERTICVDIRSRRTIFRYTGLTSKRNNTQLVEEASRGASHPQIKGYRNIRFLLLQIRGDIRSSLRAHSNHENVSERVRRKSNSFSLGNTAMIPRVGLRWRRILTLRSEGAGQRITMTFVRDEFLDKRTAEDV